MGAQELKLLEKIRAVFLLVLQNLERVRPAVGVFTAKEPKAKS